MEKAAITIIGAGVVGLAIAAELSRTGNDVIVLERHDYYGRETSSRNSEVIHAGIYYPEGSLKAHLCVEGAAELYRYCEARAIRHRRIGKLIVATSPEEEPELDAVFRSGLRNGCRNLSLIGQQELRTLEPNVKGVSALLSPHTGILDAHGLMQALYLDARAAGTLFSFGSRVSSIEHSSSGYEITVAPETYRFTSDVLINAAGLEADRIAAMAGINVDAAGYRIHFWKGSYFSYAKPSPVSRLIYPLPHAGLSGLGIHATLDLGGRLRFGPDAEPVDAIDYRVDPSGRDRFYQAAAALITPLERDALAPDMAGIRPKLGGPGVRDFVICHEVERGLQGLINLIGIESPGLTSCLAIARLVADMVHEAR